MLLASRVVIICWCSAWRAAQSLNRDAEAETCGRKKIGLCDRGLGSVARASRSFVARRCDYVYDHRATDLQSGTVYCIL